MANEPGQIKDHGHASVAHDGRAGEEFDTPIKSPEGLDDGLVTAQNAIHHQAESLILALKDDHDFFDVGFRAADFERSRSRT